MASFPPPPPGESPPPHPATAGGAGWGVRERTPAPRDDWAAPVVSAPPPTPLSAAPPAATPVSAFGASYATAAPAAPRRGLLLIGAVAAVAAIAVAGVAVMASHQSQSASTDAVAVASAPPTAAPTPTPAPTPVSAAAIQAGHQYLASATPLNAAEVRFAVTYNAARHSACSCPSGQFNASAALNQLPAVIDAIQAMQTTLQHIKHELPSLYADIDAVVSDNQSVSVAYSHALYAYHKNDAAGISDALNYVATDEKSAAPDISRLRADLGLPPPPA